MLNTSACGIAVSDDTEMKRGEEPSVRPSKVVVRRLAHTSGEEFATEEDKEGAEGTGWVGPSGV